MSKQADNKKCSLNIKKLNFFYFIRVEREEEKGKC
jgi:hypothetical protein